MPGVVCAATLRRMVEVRAGGELPPVFLQQLSRAAELPLTLHPASYLQKLTALAMEPDVVIGTRPGLYAHWYRCDQPSDVRVNVSGGATG